MAACRKELSLRPVSKRPDLGAHPPRMPGALARCGSAGRHPGFVAAPLRVKPRLLLWTHQAAEAERSRSEADRKP